MNPSDGPFSPARVAVWLESDVPHLSPTDGQVRRFASRLPAAAVTLARGEGAFLRDLRDADTAVVWRFRQDYFALAPKLRRVATPAAGRDYFDVRPPPGVRLVYGAFHGPLMAETVLGMMLGACRGLLTAAAAMGPENPWPRGELGRPLLSLRGSRVTILGFGSIGRWIGRLAKPFGTRLTGVNRRSLERPDYFDDADRATAVDELDRILPDTDHLVLCLPSGPDSDGLINAARLSLLPPTAGLYNVGRGNCVDESALAAALRSGRLRHACLDVFAREPLTSDSPLWGAPGFYPLPHLSAAAPDYLDLFFAELPARL